MPLVLGHRLQCIASAIEEKWQHLKKKKNLKKINVRMLKTVNDAKKESFIFVQIMLTSGYIIVLECPSYYRTHTLLIWQ